MLSRSLSTRRRTAPDRAGRRGDPGGFVPPVLGLALSGAVLLGCVGLSTHEEVVSERDALAEKARLLEASNKSLSAERVALLENLEDTREQRIALDRSVRALRKQEATLSKSLSAREAELAKQNAEVARLRGTYEALVDDLESELAAGQIEIQQLREGLRVNVSDEILFASGSARIGEAGAAVLMKVAGQLGKLEHAIEIEGHTDDIPITGTLTQRYPSNWELAGARASSVVRLFERAGVASSRLVVVSYASTHPVAPNDTAENRSRNRRIEIRLKPDGASRADAAAGEARPGESREEKPPSNS